MLLLWRAMLAIFLTAAGLLLHALRPGQVSALGVAAALLPAYLGLALAPLGARRRLAPARLRAAQIALDTGAIAILYAVTGAAAGAVPVFFCVPIVLAATCLGRTAATAVAAWAALCAVAVPLLGGGAADPAVLLVATVQASVFLAVGLVSGELAARARRRRRQQLAAERQVRRASSEVRSILDQLGSGFLALDRREVVTRLNPAGARILGLAAEAAVGRPCAEILGPARRELTEALRAALADGAPRRRLELEIAPEGRAVPIGVTVDFVDAGGGAAGVAAVFTDLTEVRRMQEQLRRADRLAGVGELAASIAHEIRNPLASIRGSVEILAGELDLAGHQEQLLQLILKESARVNRIIEDFLDFARVRPPQPRPVRLETFLPDVVLQVDQHVRAHGGVVDVRWSAPVGGLVVAVDPEQFVQVVLNLAINACEAMHYRGELRLDAVAEDGACVCRIADSGPGLDPELRDRYFEPFVTTKRQGTGLGLTIVARIVHGHGGAIEAANGPDGGAVFTLRLPLSPNGDDGRDADQPSRNLLACR